MTEDATPPTPLPPAAQSPYPAHPAPQARHDETPAEAPSTEVTVPIAGIGLGPLGMTLIGGAVAAVGLAIAMPFLWRRKPKAPAPKPRSAPRKRTTPKKSS